MGRKRISGCFDSVTKLKNHNPVVLCDCLERFPQFLSHANIALPKDRDPDKILHDRLLQALMSPSAPDALTVLLILVNKLGNETGWQEVAFEANQAGKGNSPPSKPLLNGVALSPNPIDSLVKNTKAPCLGKYLSKGWACGTFALLVSFQFVCIRA